ncbi:STAS domain-containing protein [Mycobacterium sp. PS03-16]|uniref:STAS domain-containing protein n=1 Tax=Mycobacterium sp. PS03-16 TaxID=2559611 RepID=UPI001073467D|nr:STAS domain-containing protein [Mycobacterium sp. PS03-16]TFV55880.1 STAS domain-containing protein [Mycobacterium sp. PS03-16]
MATELTVRADRGDDGDPRLIAVGEIDLSNVEDFTAALTALLDGDTAAAVTVDLAAVEYLDSAAVNVLAIHADQAARMRVIAHPYLIPVLRISGICELADVHTADGSRAT